MHTVTLPPLYAGDVVSVHKTKMIVVLLLLNLVAST